MNILQKRKRIDDDMALSAIKVVKHRTPWLVLGLFGGILAAEVIKGFENLLENHIYLVAFIPLIVYMSDAVGTQTETFTIRDIALHPKVKFSQYFAKQIVITSIIAAILSSLLFVLAFLFQQNTTVGTILSLSLFISILSTTTTGVILPEIFERLNLDPANASGPISTIIQDLLSVSIYLAIAQTLL